MLNFLIKLVTDQIKIANEGVAWAAANHEASWAVDEELSA